MTGERLHINEAVRTYNKTRQTFYNWINKGYLKSKKINNKIYVATKDVEQLLSDYIGDLSDEPMIPETVLQTETSPEPAPASDHYYELIAELHQQKHHLTQKVDDQKITLMHELHLTKQELRTDIQRAAEGMQQQLYLTTQQQTTTLTPQIQHLTSRLEKITISSKKQRFRIGYLLALAANITVLTLLAL